MNQVLLTNEEVDEKYTLNNGIGSQPVISGKATINHKLQGKIITIYQFNFHRIHFKIKLIILKLGSI